MESDDIIDADDVDVEPEETGNVHSDEELDAGSDDECPYEYNPWNESDEEDDGYENILSPLSARGRFNWTKWKTSTTAMMRNPIRTAPVMLATPNPT